MKAPLPFLLVVTMALPCGACSKNKLHPSAATALSAPTDVVLYSLEPEGGADASESLHDFTILGRTKLDRERMPTAINAFRAAISDWDGAIYMCFNPRQAIRVTAHNHTYDFLLCYECHQLYVYEDDKLLQSLGASGSPKVLNDLLKTAGIPLAKGETEEEIAARQKKDQETEARWLAAMPKSLRPFWTKMRKDILPDLKPFRATLAREYPDAERRILALLKWYGSGAGPWSGFPSYEDVAGHLLVDFSPAQLIAASERSDLTDPQVEGAARLFAGWHFLGGRENLLDILPPSLKNRLLEHSLKSADSDKIERAKNAFGEP
jgi:hypothetical protein